MLQTGRVLEQALATESWVINKSSGILVGSALVFRLLCKFCGFENFRGSAISVLKTNGIFRSFSSSNFPWVRKFRGSAISVLKENNISVLSVKAIFRGSNVSVGRQFPCLKQITISVLSAEAIPVPYCGIE